MTTIRGFSHSEVWLRAVERVVSDGRRVSPRGMETFELPWMQLETYDPMTIPLSVKGREFRDVIGVLEGLSLVGEFNVPELFTGRVAKFEKFMDGGVLWGAYGQRAHGAFENVVELLQRDPDSRQAVVTFFDHHRDLNRTKLDIPCTISGQFLLRDSGTKDEPDPVLELGISMRSNDLWLGTPYDFVQFTILQASVAQALGARVGRYVHRVGSLHLYVRDYERSTGLTFRGESPMTFPLWDADSVREIQRRARGLALGEVTPQTPFEQWADGLLRE